MPTRHYVNTATPTALTVACLAADTTISVSSQTGWPTEFPFTAVIDRTIAGKAEIVNVVGRNNLVLTVQRGQDGTVAVDHGINAVVTHDHTARDYTETQERLDALETRTGPMDLTRLFLFGGL